MLPAVHVTAAFTGGPFSGRHLSFVPLAGNGNVDFHGDSSVSPDLLGISATLARQRKCLVLDSFLIRGPFATSWSLWDPVGFSYTSQSLVLFGTRRLGILMHRLTPARGEDRLLLALVFHTSQKDLDKLLYCSVSLYFWVSIHIVLDTYKYKFLVTVLFVSLPLPSFLGLAFW